MVEQEKMIDKMHCRLEPLEKKILTALAKTAGRPYKEIEYAYRCVGSFDLTVMCVSLSCQLNMDLMDMARHVESAMT